MWVNPFIAGVLATIGVEWTLLVIYAAYVTRKGRK